MGRIIAFFLTLLTNMCIRVVGRLVLKMSISSMGMRDELRVCEHVTFGALAHSDTLKPTEKSLWWCSGVFQQNTLCPSWWEEDVTFVPSEARCMLNQQRDTAHGCAVRSPLEPRRLIMHEVATQRFLTNVPPLLLFRSIARAPPGGNSNLTKTLWSPRWKVQKERKIYKKLDVTNKILSCWNVKFVTCHKMLLLPWSKDSDMTSDPL